jgi:murein DD-endopeptidase MepM/ murein hydrolase activator NlpD
MTASNDRRLRHHVTGRRFLQILLTAFVLAPVLSLQSSVPVARADGLTDAIAEQQRLAKLIADQKAQLAKLNGQQVSLSKQITATQQSLGGVLNSLDDAKAQVAALDSQLAAARAQYSSLAARETVLDTNLAQVTAQRNAKQAQLETRRQILASRLVDAYVTDQTPLLQQILTSHSVTEALSDVSYYTDMAEADKALAAQIQSDEEELAQLQEDTSMAADAAHQLTVEAAAQKTELDKQAVQLADTQSQLEALQNNLEKQLASLQASEEKLVADQTALNAAIASNGKALDQLGAKIDDIVRQQGGEGRIPSVYNGTFNWPMSGVITQQFGCTGVLSEPRVGNCAHFHQGIDIAAPCLTPVYAAGAGVVVFVNYNPYDAPPQAWLVIIAHSTSLVTWYAHMQAKPPAGIYVGASVAQGQLVGLEASTGHSTGCHLHWAVRVNGVFTNPRLFL